MANVDHAFSSIWQRQQSLLAELNFPIEDQLEVITRTVIQMSYKGKVIDNTCIFLICA